MAQPPARTTENDKTNEHIRGLFELKECDRVAQPPALVVSAETTFVFFPHRQAQCSVSNAISPLPPTGRGAVSHPPARCAPLREVGLDSLGHFFQNLLFELLGLLS